MLFLVKKIAIIMTMFKCYNFSLAPTQLTFGKSFVQLSKCSKMGK